VRGRIRQKSRNHEALEEYNPTAAMAVRFPVCQTSGVVTQSAAISKSVANYLKWREMRMMNGAYKNTPH